ncbi:hypothetical protein [Saccharopolyspora phatthalungensis]|uniref:Uncharacterized protein n=1 Tax=Saccharopolyspora phatthalungensis TaxID=664693 RepID=A0A840QAA7_9PSEU|nr:hypothetical protein [Saccharopolyspora phatthalungensis]MBB5157346.1 hypothetical protein [Saccharopolyspora phatthalungensis]
MTPRAGVRRSAGVYLGFYGFPLLGKGITTVVMPLLLLDRTGDVLTAIARAYAGHTDAGRATTFNRAQHPGNATALATLTGEPPPIAEHHDKTARHH